MHLQCLLSARNEHFHVNVFVYFQLICVVHCVCVRVCLPQFDLCRLKIIIRTYFHNFAVQPLQWQNIQCSWIPSMLTVFRWFFFRSFQRIRAHDEPSRPFYSYTPSVFRLFAYGRWCFVWFDCLQLCVMQSNRDFTAAATKWNLLWAITLWYAAEAIWS